VERGIPRVLLSGRSILDVSILLGGYLIDFGGSRSDDVVRGRGESGIRGACSLLELGVRNLWNHRTHLPNCQLWKISRNDLRLGKQR
jgi:hypothetical protein